MRIAIIGRTEILFETMKLLVSKGYDISIIITSKEASEYKIKRKQFEEFAKEKNIPFFYGSKIHNFKEAIIKSNSDIGVSINYSAIIPSNIIKYFELGILNAHGGDLPSYRGNACQAWAILNGEKYIGLCIHKMVGDELDNGDIICRKYLDIDLNTKITDVWNWMNKTTPKLFLNALSKLEKDNDFYLEKQSQKPEKSSRCYPRCPEDGKIDWNNSAINIIRLINASNKPYTGAFCFFEKKRITIWDAELVEDHENYYAVPGQVTKIGNNFIEVSCGQGKIRLSLIEFSGKNISPSKLIKTIRKRLN